MKTLDGLEIKRGDQVLAPGDANFVVMGVVHELYDRTEEVRVGGYGLRISSKNCVMAKSAFDAYAGLMIKQAAEKAAAEKAAETTAT